MLIALLAIVGVVLLGVAVQRAPDRRLAGSTATKPAPAQRSTGAAKVSA